jgi:hypothetical protein
MFELTQLIAMSFNHTTRFVRTDVPVSECYGGDTQRNFNRHENERMLLLELLVLGRV